MDVYELLTKSLEDAEFDIYNATDVDAVDTARRKALALSYSQLVPGNTGINT